MSSDVTPNIIITYDNKFVASPSVFGDKLHPSQKCKFNVVSGLYEFD